MPIVGEILAERYRIDGRLGAGGMASVWLAHDLRLDRDVAVKVLLPNLAADPSVAQRFEREARSLAAAAHPGVVAVFDVEPGDPDGGREPFYVMELAEGGSFAERLARPGRMRAEEVVATVGAVGEGLAELHRRGIVHRDIKPHNIVFAGGRPKLADFGLARSEGAIDATGLTATGATMGTLAYLAPELLGGAPATPASDVYALGVVTFQALTGRLPRPAGSMTEVVENRFRQAPPVSQVAPELGAAFDAPLAAALAINPAARPDAGQLVDGLGRAVGMGGAGASEAYTTVIPLPIPAPPPIRVAEPGRELPTWARRGAAARASERRGSRPRPAILALAAFAIVLLILLAASGRLGGGAVAPGASTSPTAAASEASVPPSPSNAPPSAPPPSAPPPSAPPPTVAPADRVAAALGSLEQQIVAAESAGLGDGDARKLRRKAQDVADKFAAGDVSEARKKAEELVADAEHAAEKLPADVASSLQAAAAQVRDALPPAG